ncbi:FAD-binding oxidoreductase [Paenibacillus eucommiae]|uniref:FAD/FMN-containing dehydrogenase n=1 Tax=Paenibacillus eucommiae TaxID=1355755 RepID=A0ABS4IWE9_9BACL|nr:FAD-binding oxidoreductase [Paenibacillus eucommiae]MBP1991914.1 FAD/FMN-containing dehydrogenase [Paenibacillus eucommiae]
MFDLLKAEINGYLLLPEDKEYNDRRKVWNTFIDKYPAAILVCKTTSDVAAAVRFAKDKGIPVSVRGGGHHVAGTGVCDQGIMIDLSDMRKVSVDTEHRIAIVEPGATLGDVDAETQKYGLATPTGTVSETGVAGLALCGGLGYLRGKYGITSDNIAAVRIVTADGAEIQANEQENPDLYWAIRGGGGNFGVITSFEFKLYPLGPEVLAVDVMYDYKDAKQILQKAQAFLRYAPDEVSFNMMAVQLPATPGLPENLHNKRVIIIAGLYAGDKADGEKAVQPLRELASPIVDQTGIVLFKELQRKFDLMAPKDVPVYGTSLFVKELTDDTIDTLLSKLEQIPRPSVLVQFWACHGQMNRVPSDASAFAVRDASFLLLFDVDFPLEEAQLCKDWIESVYQTMLPYSLRKSSYLNTVRADTQITKDSYADNFKRLIEIKKKYDPTNFFRHNHNIDPQV